MVKFLQERRVDNMTTTDRIKEFIDSKDISLKIGGNMKKFSNLLHDMVLTVLFVAVASMLYELLV